MFIIKKLLIIPGLFILIFLPGCTYTTQVHQAIPPAMSQNVAKIYIIRPQGLWASAINSPIYVNGTYIGRLGEGGYLTWIVPPGQVAISSTKGLVLFELGDNIHHDVSFNAVKGKTYYVRTTIPYGCNIVPEPIFLLLDDSNGKALLRSVL